MDKLASLECQKLHFMVLKYILRSLGPELMTSLIKDHQ